MDGIFIKLTPKEEDYYDEIWVNVSEIQSMSRRENETIINFKGGTGGHYVKEKPKEILDKLFSAINE